MNAATLLYVDVVQGAGETVPDLYFSNFMEKSLNFYLIFYV